MLYRRSRKPSAVFLCGVMTLFSWQSSLCPVYGNDGEGIFKRPVAGVRSAEPLRISLLSNPITYLNTQQIKEEKGPDIVVNIYVGGVGAEEEFEEEPEDNTADYRNAENKSNPLARFNQEKEEEREVKKEAEKEAYSSEEVEMLARIIHGEARGEHFEGQVAVGAVVLNRVDDPRFPKTIKEVIYQQNAFTAVKDKQFYLKPDERAFRAAEAALEGMDPTGGAIYYYNPKTAQDRWIRTRPVLKQIGNHRFGI